MLLGPRQTGKSSLISSYLQTPSAPTAREYLLQLPSVREQLEADPERIIREALSLPHQNRPHLIYIDEIQKVPGLLDPLQYLLDRKTVQLIATGSSARQLRKVGANWLPGRLQLHHLYPLTWSETGWDPDRLDTVLQFGGLPGILTLTDPAHRTAQLAAYAHLYLEEEIRAEAAVRNIPRFSQFLRLAALESGSAPNYSKIGTLIGVSHTTVREYFQILEDSLLIHRIPSFGGTRAATLRTARYYFFDIGVRNAAARVGHTPEMLTLQRGLLFEHFIVLELIAADKRMPISYWRTKQGNKEIDAIVETPRGFVPIEIKATQHPQPDDFKHLAAFAAEQRTHAQWLVCCTPRAQQFPHGLAIPWWELADRLNALE